MPVVYVASSRRDRQRGRIASIIPKPSGSTRRRAKMKKIGFFFANLYSRRCLPRF